MTASPVMVTGPHKVSPSRFFQKQPRPQTRKEQSCSTLPNQKFNPFTITSLKWLLVPGQRSGSEGPARSAPCKDLFWGSLAPLRPYILGAGSDFGILPAHMRSFAVVERLLFAQECAWKIPVVLRPRSSLTGICNETQKMKKNVGNKASVCRVSSN